ncbi:MAG: molecular chaperone SurA, partial [Pseudomonadales bacterium]|nr:molecular chaperone SurA [Pseudomonadales bacterium]
MATKLIPENLVAQCARLLLPCALLFCSAPGMAEYQLLDRVVAIAEDDVVLASQVRNDMRQLKRTLAARGTNLPPDSIIYEQVLERAIIDSLQLQRAYRSGLRISDQDLNDAMQRIAAQNRLTLAQFREALEQNGQSYLDAREQMRKEMLVRRVQQRGVMRGMNIADSEIENFLQSAEGQALLEPELQLDHMLLPLPSDASQQQKQRAKSAMQNLAALASEKNFAELADALAAAGVR